MEELEVTLGAISIDSLPPNEALTGVPNTVEEFWKKERPFVESILAAGVCVPILMGEWQGEFYLIAGRRRIMGARTAIWLIEQEKVPKPGKAILNQIYHLSSKTYRNISPEDRNKLTLIENMHRSDNPIQAWIIIRELEKAGRWDEVAKQIAANKQYIGKIRKLNGLKEPEKWIDAYKKGKISDDVLFKVAASGERQQMAETKLEATGKFTGKDMKEVKNTLDTTFLAARSFDMAMPAFTPQPRHILYLVGDPVTAEVLYFGEDFKAAYELKNTRGNGFHMYTLTEV